MPRGDLGSLVAQERVGLVAKIRRSLCSRHGNNSSMIAHWPMSWDGRGRELAESKLDWRFLAADLDRFYQEVISSR